MNSIIRALTEEEKDIVGHKYKWICIEDFNFTLPCGAKGVVPKGFFCDGASGGLDVLGIEDWLVHDWLYATSGYCKLTEEGFIGQVNRYEADCVFGWSYLHRFLAVRVCGFNSWGADRVGFGGVIGSKDDPIWGRILS